MIYHRGDPVFYTLRKTRPEAMRAWEQGISTGAIYIDVHAVPVRITCNSSDLI